jgi:tRNA(His) 5'-end guanylyltransferase
MSTAAKKEFLFACGFNYNDLPVWHKRGCGLWWLWYLKEDDDP